MYVPSRSRRRGHDIHKLLLPCFCASILLNISTLATPVNGEINVNQCVIDLQLDKPVYEVGDDLVLTCTVNNTSDQCDLTSSQLYAQISGENITRETPPGNPTSAVFTIHNVTEQFNNLEIVCVGNSHSAGHTLKVGVPPQTPYDIHCVVTNIENMSCSWQPAKQNTGLDTTYSLLYSFHSFANSEPNTPCPKQEGNTCFWEKYHRDNVCSIKVTAINALGERSGKVNFKTAHVVKLNRVKNLRPSSVTTNSLQVMWEEPIKGHLIQNITYELAITSEWSETPIVRTNITHANAKITHTEIDLVPHTQYTVTVRCITIETRDYAPYDGDFWSDSVAIHVTTKSDVPKSAPWVASGGYKVKDLQTEVIWQPIPQYQVQGLFTSTRIRGFLRLDSSEPPSCDSSRTPKTQYEPRGYTSTLRLETNRTYDICVDVVNDIGYNDSLSLEAIRKPAYQPPLPEFYAVKHESEVKVHVLGWNVTQNYTVYWCDGLILRQQCREQVHFQWMPVTGAVTSLAAGPDVSLVVAMSADYMDDSHNFTVSSGMNFAPYLFRAGKDVQSPSQVTVLPKKGLLFIEWLKPSYSDTAYINRFRIVICPVDVCDGTNDTIVDVPVREQLDGTPQTYRVQGLVEGQTYNIRVCSVGDESGSPYTDAVQATIPVTGLQKRHIIIISVCSIISAFLIAAGIYTIVRYCRKKCMKLLEPITIQEVPDDVADKYLEQNGNKTSSVDPYVDIDAGRNTSSYWPGGKLQVEVPSKPTAVSPTTDPPAAHFTPALSKPNNEKALPGNIDNSMSKLHSIALH